MPEGLADTREIMRWLAELSPRTYINVMDQYHPDGAVLRNPDHYRAIARPTTAHEHRHALELARAAGLSRIDVRRPHPRLRARLPVL
jgi:putative pyruvate formate lyase activating enzyme